MRHPELVTEGHFEAIISRYERENWAIFTDIVCPLCGIEFTLETLERHLGRHLQEIALFALPYYGGGSSESKSKVLRYSSESVSDLSSVEFDSESEHLVGDQPIFPPITTEEIRCICSYQHDDGFLINCDKCNELQHGVCMGIDENNVPEVYMCSACTPGPYCLEIERAINFQKSFLKSYQRLLSTSGGLGLDKQKLAMLRHMAAKLGKDTLPEDYATSKYLPSES